MRRSCRWMPTTMTPKRCRRLASRGTGRRAVTPPRRRSAPSTARGCSELVASSTKSTTAGRSAVCAICTAPIWYGEIDAVGARALQLARRVLGLRAADDEQIRTEHAGAQDGVDVLGVGADGRNQSARPFDAHALEHLLAAGVRLDGQHPVVRWPSCSRSPGRVRRRRTGCSGAGAARPTMLPMRP